MTIAAEEVARGWGGPLGLLAGVVAFLLIAGTLEYLKTRNSSPTPAGPRRTGVNPQVEQVSDTDDTDHDTKPWWGQIIDRDGHRVRRVAHILRTGESLPDDEFDVALDDPEETAEEYVARLLDEEVPYAEIVRETMREYGVSEATAKRRIREARQPAD